MNAAVTAVPSLSVLSISARYITQNIIPGGVRHVIQEAAESVDRFFILGWEERGRCRGVTRRAPDKAVEIFNNVGHLTKTTPNGISEIGAPAAKQVVSKGHTLPLEVFMTKNKGWGLRCKERIPIGAFVCEYVGEVIKEGDVVRRPLAFCFSTSWMLSRGYPSRLINRLPAVQGP